MVKQDYDFSCGSAALASILNGFYGVHVTEKDMLQAMPQDGAASFADLAEVAKKYGLKSAGLIIEYKRLLQLNIPTIVHLKYKGLDHFSVVRGVSTDWVWLGAPSWGNRRLHKSQFLSMWPSDGEKTEAGVKILLILPENMEKVSVNDSFFGFYSEVNLPYNLVNQRKF